MGVRRWASRRVRRWRLSASSRTLGGRGLCGRAIISLRAGERMSMQHNATMDLQWMRRDAKTHESVPVPSRALPSSLRPNLFSGD
jgi:hypothetical protein